MRWDLNLARRPFVNRRPVVRLSILLWLVGALLLAGNVWLYWDFLVGRSDVHSRRAEVEEAIRTEAERIAALEDELASYDLEAQNRQVAYLNQRIVRRQFSWSRLFDELEEVLPQDVRIDRLSPSNLEGDGRGARGRAPAGTTEAGPGKVVLSIDAESKTNEAILEMVDALWADPAFERPNLIQQSENQGGRIRFRLETIYDSPLPETGVDAEPDAEPASAGPRELRLDDSATALGRPASSPPELS